MRSDAPRPLVSSRISDQLFRGVCAFAAYTPVIVAILVLGSVVWAGAGQLSVVFAGPALTSLLPDLAGSLVLALMTGAIAIPFGVGAAVYLEELAPHRRLAAATELLIANLAAVPSALYGLVGLAVFVRTLGLGRSLLTGALTLAMVVLPIVTLAAVQGLRTVPAVLRHGGLALGATRWTTFRILVFPAALPSMVTGAIVAMGRALGEGAALLMLGGFAYLSAVDGRMDAPLAALPVRVFFWASDPAPERMVAAAAGVLVLLAVLLVLGGLAVAFQRSSARRSGLSNRREDN
ncbi:MAG: phosphate transport system permease protein [Myxococcota bacterium]|jgi:phosphate transport system permease protein